MANYVYEFFSDNTLNTFTIKYSSALAAFKPTLCQLFIDSSKEKLRSTEKKKDFSFHIPRISQFFIRYSI